MGKAYETLCGWALGTHWEQDEPTPPCPPLRQGKKKFNLMERVGFFIPNSMGHAETNTPILGVCVRSI